MIITINKDINAATNSNRLQAVAVHRAKQRPVNSELELRSKILKKALHSV
jgi:hypothetical protein